MPDTPKITTKVRDDAAWVASRAKAVRIDDDALGRFARTFTDVPVPEWDDDLHFNDGTEKTAMYVILLDAMNFCFWPSAFAVEYRGRRFGDDDGYPALAVALRRAFEEGMPLWDPRYLAELPYDDLARVFRGEGELSLLDARHRNAVDLGSTLLRAYDGDVRNLVAKARGDAPAMVAELATSFACYADHRAYEGRRIDILKRAQLCVSDLAGTFRGRDFGAFDHLDELTCFADYKLPQLFRNEGVFAYDERLDRAILAEEELAEGSPEEVEIRCMTIHCVELLKAHLAALGRRVTSRELDWMLWNRSIEPGAVSVPFHRTRTTSY